MSKANIAIFVPHIGCPHMCSFCDQRSITGQSFIPRADDVQRICADALKNSSVSHDSEAAFFGGSFTAIERGYMTELLQAAQPFIGKDKFSGIRISTRPDYIDDETLSLLKKYNVTAIELGAQSMSNSVLEANERGHTAEQIETAARLIKAHGFELGLQMMIGLYKSSEADERETMRRIAMLAPDTVRIYPTVIIKGTRLAELFESGEYKPFEFDKAVELSVEAMKLFYARNIKVIKVGLHASELVETSLVGGFYHPAFRELCESRLYRDCIERHSLGQSRIKVSVSPNAVSLVSGHKKCNKGYFHALGKELEIKTDKSIEKYFLKIGKDVYNVFEIT